MGTHIRVHTAHAPHVRAAQPVLLVNGVTHGLTAKAEQWRRSLPESPGLYVLYIGSPAGEPPTAL